MGRYTPAQAASAKKYLASLDEIKIRAPKGTKDKIRNAAEAAGVSVNQFVLDAVMDKIKQ